MNLASLPELLPCVSVRQPWAWLIVNGYKPVENRDWPTRFRGRLLIHASGTVTQRDYRETVASLRDHGLAPPELPDLAHIERGGIVGIVNMTDCLPEVDSPWYVPGSYAWMMANARPLPFVPWKGRLGFFNVPETEVRL